MIIPLGTEITSNSVLYSRRDRYRTVPIAKEVTPYLRVTSRRGPTNGSLSFITPVNNSAISIVQSQLSSGSPTRTALLNVAYDRLITALGETAQIGANIAEGRETAKLVQTQGSRVKGLFDGFKSIFNANSKISRASLRIGRAVYALKRGRLQQFCDILSVKRKRSHQSVFKPSDRAISGYWLEYWFGVAPLVSDVMTSLEVLTRDFPKGRIYGTSKDSEKGISQKLASWVYTYAFQTKARMGCEVKLINPNGFLRNALGLTNFWLIGWNVIPFSFLADWGLNVSKCLGAMSDFEGLEVTLPFTSMICKANTVDILVPPSDPVQASFTAVETWRSPGLTKPVLSVTLPKRLSVTRALTSVALMLQLFT